MFLFPLLVSEETEIQKPSPGDIWQLETRSSRLSNSSGEVLYYLPNDAYNTYRARKFNEWDEPSSRCFYSSICNVAAGLGSHRLVGCSLSATCSYQTVKNEQTGSEG